jgi:hypothetical protein
VDLAGVVAGRDGTDPEVREVDAVADDGPNSITRLPIVASTVS